jgi:hypothetical protein
MPMITLDTGEAVLDTDPFAIAEASLRALRVKHLISIPREERIRYMVGLQKTHGELCAKRVKEAYRAEQARIQAEKKAPNV